MIELLLQIGERLQSSAYVNEAAISHGIVIPILRELGWDTADPRQVVPEFSNARGRVDFALMGLGQKPAIFVEVKQVGRAIDGDRQLFEYAFHQGVPLCVLTDGREWSFYLPGGHGSYDDRRVYRLQLDDRSPAECETVLSRYLRRDAVLDQSAFENARRDHHAIAGKREALAVLPRAWAELLADRHENLIDTLIDKAEALSGYAPSGDDALAYLKTLGSGTQVAGSALRHSPPTASVSVPPSRSELPSTSSQSRREVTYRLFGTEHIAANASIALAEILGAIVKTDLSKIEALSAAVRSPKRNHIARSPGEIYPNRPDLARAAEIAPGWLVGLNIANREKMMIIRAACQKYEISMPADLDIALPNA